MNNTIPNIIIGTGIAFISHSPYAYSNAYKPDLHYYKTQTIQETSMPFELLNSFDYEQIFHEKVKGFYESFIQSQKPLPKEVITIMNENMSALYERFEI